MHRIRCSEVWGGIRNIDMDVCTNGLTASLWSSSCDGGQGGDIYYFSVCSSDLLTRIALADVMGHGQIVSRLSEWVYDALAARMNSLEGDGVLSDLNRLVSQEGYTAMTTAAVVAFYKSNSNLYFAYAGHPPMLIRRRGASGWQAATIQPTIRIANLPLGVQADAPYEQEQTILQSGDRLFLYTDGVIEAPSRDGELFGEARLLATLQASGAESLQGVKKSVLDSVRRHAGNPFDHDDVTLMALEVG